MKKEMETTTYHTVHGEFEYQKVFEGGNLKGVSPPKTAP